MNWIGALALVCLLGYGCRCHSPEEQIRRDLIGHTMGGREASWKFQSADQIKSLIVETQRGDAVIVNLVLHDARVRPYYAARALLTYEGAKLQTVGLLAIRQLP